MDDLITTLTRRERMRLARALFETQERLMPEGENWEDLDDGARSFWYNSVNQVLWDLQVMVNGRKTSG